MHRNLLLTSLAFFILSNAVAQTPFTTCDSVNINRINARILVHGDMFWNPQEGVAACQFPAGSGKDINFVAALWMGGYDGSGQLHVSAQTYRQTGNDYWPGPLTSDTLTYATSQNWAKIWKVSNSDIQSFLATATHTTTNTPQSILTWPGKGNTYAAGNAGAALTVSTGMAPFVDLNGDGIYEPLDGEYPDIKGDQALWWVFSDNGPSHGQTNGKPFGMEIHAMAYAYNRGTLIDNVIYFDYNLINRSSNTYTNTRLGLFDDIDLGWYDDDYIGFDSSHRMGVQYNGNNDDGAGGGFPYNSYGTHIPIVGMTMIVLPGDVGTSYIPAGSFIYFNNDASIIGNPVTDTQYNYYLNAQMNNGQHFTNDFQGPGIPCPAMGTGPNCNYVYTGDPSNAAQWSECGCNNTPGDRRFIISSNDMTLSPGSSQHIVMAFVTTNPDTLNGCPGASFDSLKIIADTAWTDYFNPPAVLTAVSNVTAGSINIYPNPAHDVLYIQVTGSLPGDEQITIYNCIGQVMDLAIDYSGTKDGVNISSLPPGLYNVLYRKGNVQKIVKFLKE